MHLSEATIGQISEAGSLTRRCLLLLLPRARVGSKVVTAMVRLLAESGQEVEVEEERAWPMWRV